MFRDALRLFVQMVFVANAAAAVSVTTIVFQNHMRSAALLVAIACFLTGLLSGLVFGLKLMTSLHRCRQKYLIEGPMRYFLGDLSHVEFATLHRESALQRLTMSTSAAVALLAFAAGIALAVYSALQDLHASHFVGRALRDPGRGRRITDPPAGPAHPHHHKESTMHRHACILVDVHPRLRLMVGGLPNPSLAALPRMNNLHSNDT